MLLILLHKYINFVFGIKLLEEDEEEEEEERQVQVFSQTEILLAALSRKTHSICSLKEKECPSVCVIWQNTVIIICIHTVPGPMTCERWHKGPDLLTACASANHLLVLKQYCQDLLKTCSKELVLKRRGLSYFCAWPYCICICRSFPFRQNLWEESIKITNVCAHQISGICVII